MRAIRFAAVSFVRAASVRCLLGLAVALMGALPVFAGITIHYEGTAASPDAVGKIIAAVTSFAQANHWRVEDTSAEKGQLERVVLERTVNYSGKVTGVVVHVNDSCEPIHFEFGDDLVMQDNVKTQFAGAKIHIRIVEMLESVREYFSKLEVDDEGGYWGDHDKAELDSRLDQVDTMIAEQKRKHPELQGPFRLKSGRIADVAK
jgi:hypothetical protein